jgi:hypothetical protein
MKKVMSKQAIEVWEAWIDLQCTNGSSKGTLFIWGEVYIGNSSTVPFLIKKNVQGAEPSCLYLDIFPLYVEEDGRLAEVRYSEAVYDLDKYQTIRICLGEEVLVEIREIEKIS